MDIRKNKKDFLGPKGNSWETTLSYLKQLDSKLETEERKLNYYDLYKIVSAVDSEEQLYSAKASLYPNTALIVNAAQRITLDGESYKRGDLIVRLNNGSYTHVKSEAGGYWAPNKLTKLTGTSETQESANTYQLQYVWGTDTISPDGEKTLTPNNGGTTDPSDLADKPVETINLNYAVEGQMQIYGVSKVATTKEQQTSFNFPLVVRKDENNQYQIIWPVVKCFAANNEEVACEVRYEYQYDSNTHTGTITYQWPAPVVTKMVIK